MAASTLAGRVDRIYGPHRSTRGEEILNSTERLAPSPVRNCAAALPPSAPVSACSPWPLAAAAPPQGSARWRTSRRPRPSPPSWPSRAMPQRNRSGACWSWTRRPGRWSMRRVPTVSRSPVRCASCSPWAPRSTPSAPTTASKHRFTGPVAGGVLSGDLILVASGDLTFGGRARADATLDYTDFDHNEAHSFYGSGLTPEDPLAAVDELARQVYAAGIRRVEGDVVIDDRLFDSFRVPNGDVLISPMSLNENLIDFTLAPGAQTGDRALLDWRPLNQWLLGQRPPAHGRPRLASRHRGLRRQRGQHRARLHRHRGMHRHHLGRERQGARNDTGGLPGTTGRRFDPRQRPAGRGPGLVGTHRLHRRPGARRRDGVGQRRQRQSCGPAAPVSVFHGRVTRGQLCVAREFGNWSCAIRRDRPDALKGRAESSRHRRPTAARCVVRP